MKNSLIAISLFLISQTSFAQMVTGSGGNPDAQNPVITKKEDDGSITNKGYFHLALQVPYGKMGGSEPKYPGYALQGGEPLGFGTGLGIEVGLLSYFHSLPLPENVKVGLNIGILDLGFVQTPPSAMLSLGPSLGLLGTVKIFDGIMGDAYFSFCPKLCIGDINDNVSTFDLNRWIFYNKRIGFQGRINNFAVGTDFEFGNATGITDTSTPSSYSFSTRIMKLKIGFTF